MKTLMKTLQGRTNILQMVAVSLLVVFHSNVGISAEVSGSDEFLIFRYEDDMYMDLFLDPAHYADGDTVYFEMKGGNGSGTGDAAGGKGAAVGRYFNVGKDIPLDAIIRLIPGSAGRPGAAASAGGSGSGVFYQHPDTLGWQPLLIAGGGGGAAEGNSNSYGRPGNLSEQGSDGRFHYGSGGKNGNGGNAYYEKGHSKWRAAGGGGGLYSRGGHPQADSHKNSVDSDTLGHGGAPGYSVMRGRFWNAHDNGCVKYPSLNQDEIVIVDQSCGQSANYEFTYNFADGLIMPRADNSLALSFYEDDDVGRLHCIGSEDCEVPNHVVLHFDYFNKQFHVRDQPETCINTSHGFLTLEPCDDGSTLDDAATWTVSYCNKGAEYLTDSHDATCVAYEKPDLLAYVPPSNGPIGGNSNHGFGVGIGGIGGSNGGGGGGYSGGGAGGWISLYANAGGGGGGSYIGPDGDWTQYVHRFIHADINKEGYIIYPARLMTFPASVVMTEPGGSEERAGENRQLRLELVLPNGSRRDITRDYATTWSVESGMMTVDQYGVAVVWGSGCGEVRAVYDLKYTDDSATTTICGNSYSYLYAFSEDGSSFSNGHYIEGNVNAEFPFACFDGSNWKITENSNLFTDGEAECQKLGSNYTFKTATVEDDAAIVDAIEYSVGYDSLLYYDDGISHKQLSIPEETILNGDIFTYDVSPSMALDSIAMPSCCMATFWNRAGTDYKFVYSFGVVSAPTFKDGGEVGEIWFSSKADNGGNFNHPPMKIWVNSNDIRDIE